VTSSGPKTLKVIVPVGAAPSLSRAVSCIGEPAGAVAEAVVASTGCVSGGGGEAATATSSPGSPHDVAAASLLLSPE